MGQSPSIYETTPHRDPPFPSRFILDHYHQLPSMSTPDRNTDEADRSDGRDYTLDLPDECLGIIFRFLGAGDRKRSSLVCRRWILVDADHRRRLSLHADAAILPFIPRIFSRFGSVRNLALRCDRKSISIDDDSLVLISLRCVSLTRLKLRGCREITDHGVAAFAQKSRGLKKLSAGSCSFGADGINAVLEHCSELEELSLRRMLGINDASEKIGGGKTPATLRHICLKEISNGQKFRPLIAKSKSLKTLKLFRCPGNWDRVFEKLGKRNRGVTEIHLEKIHVTDLGLSMIAKCSDLETLHFVKTPMCSDFGLISVAENCKLLKKLHIYGSKKNKIGDDGLIAVAIHCPEIQELVLVGVNPTSLSLDAIASNCKKLERLALCSSESIGDEEFACITAKCKALKKLCIKGCSISNAGLKTLAWGCPNLAKMKVKKCKGVNGEVREWLRETRGALKVNWDFEQSAPLIVAAACLSEGVESSMELPLLDQVAVAVVASSSNNPLVLLRTKLSILTVHPRGH